MGVDNPTRLTDYRSEDLSKMPHCEKYKEAKQGNLLRHLWGRWKEIKGQSLLYTCHSKNCAYFQFFIIQGCQNKQAVWIKRFLMTLEFLMMDAKSGMMDAAWGKTHRFWWIPALLPQKSTRIVDAREENHFVPLPRLNWSCFNFNSETYFLVVSH